MTYRIPCVVAMFLLSTAAMAQDAERRLSISGSIVEAPAGAPLPGATAQIVGSRYGAVAGADGNYRIYDVPPGTYQVRFSFVGYDAVIKTDIVITTARPVMLDAELSSRPTQGAEVVVRSDYFRRNSNAATSVQTLGSEEIRRLPGGFEDIVRAISTLPGVAQASNGRNDLLVRGGAPSENLFLIDNIESPNINHFGTQGSGGGPLSFVNLDFVKSTTFSTGGFGAKYGDRISSVLNIDLRDGRDDRLGGKGTISASQFGLDLEGPFSNRGTFLFSARRSYLDFIFKAAGLSFVPEYWDFLGKASYRLGPDDQLSALAIGAIDRIRQFNRDADDRFDNSRILDNSQDQLVAGITWRHLFDGGYITSTFGRTVVDFRFRQSDTLGAPIFTNTSTEDELNFRSDAVFLTGGDGELGIGIGGKTIGFDASIFLRSPGDTLDIAPSRRFYKSSAYAQYSLTFPWGMSGTLGARADYFSGIEQKFYPSLRAALSQPVDELSSISMSAGRYFQAPSYIWLVANNANANLKDIRTDVIVLGIDRTIVEDTRLSLEGYYKRYDDYPASLARPYLVLANTGAGFGGADDGFSSFGLESLTSGGTGRSYGVEFLLQKKLSEIRCYGTASLSLNRSFFTALDGVERPSNFDQQVIFNLSGGYKLTEEWEFGMKFRFATGRPFTPVAATGDPSFGYRDVSLYNTLRLSASHALDIRIDKRWPFPSWNLITYIDIQNIYNRKNPDLPRWSAREQGPATGDNRIGILPSIGISGEF
ncbi:MAG: TonB-dependent receptor [Bacteroidota bacterium]